MIEQIKLKYYYLPWGVKRAAKLGLIIAVSFGGLYISLKHQQNQPSVRELSPSMRQWQKEQAENAVKKVDCYSRNFKDYCNRRYR